VNAEMAVLCRRGARPAALRRQPQQRRRQQLLDRAEEALKPQAIEHVFEARALAVRAVALGDEDAHHGGGDRDALLRPQQHACVAGEVVMAGDAAERHAEVDAGRRRLALAHGDRGETDIVGVLEHGHGAAAVEGDVELARQAVELAMIEDVIMELACERPRVDELGGIDAGGRAARDVADVVGAGAARGETQVLNCDQHVDGVRRADLADLHVGARRHIRIAAAPALGDVGDAAELHRGEDAVRHPQAAHEGVLRRRHVEEAVELVAEDIDPLREARCGDVLAQHVPEVERMALPFRQLLGRELAAGGEHAILRQPMNVGGQRRRRQRGWGHTPRNQATEETFEILLLLFGKTGIHENRGSKRDARD
jgi:hypothetical protein